VIGRELNDPNILPENVYNMDETEVLLSVLNSLKVLVGKNNLRNGRGTGVKRTLITAIECISTDGRCLDPAHRVAFCNTPEHIDHLSYSWMVFCLLQD
jgi:molybdopterin/thiamine biosynthesis adenylyltransferase